MAPDHLDAHESSGRAVTRGASAVGRSLGLTWWYTVVSILSIELGLLLTWVPAVVGAADGRWWRPVLYVAAGLTWLASTSVLLLAYRRARRLESFGETDWSRSLLPVAPWVGSVVAGAALGVSTGSLVLAVATVAHPLCLLRWPPGTRRRGSLLLVVVVVAVAVLDTSWGSLTFAGGGSIEVALSYAVLMAPLTSFTLWWWDLVEELDRARLTEGRLAATQERLRVASDVHDLQGHHLQVIALQLELAERLLAADPDAAAEQVRAARVSVDEARQGTRDLALRFRGVPLPDELANAADLMHAADLQVGLQVAPDAADAPADVLGPVVRETTTNVLKHGAGTWVEMSLVRDADRWTYRISNDHDHPEATDHPGASGIAGIVDRVRAVGGDASVERTASTFALLVTVPERPEETR